jgi:hypothetical protein
MKSIVYDMFPLVMAGVKVKIFDEVGHADIYSLRAQIVAHFLADENKPTDLVFVDNDVGWPAGGLHKLLDHDVDLVAGAYPKRDYPIKFMFRSEMDLGPDGHKHMNGDPETGLIEVWGMPGGFMRCTRSMLEKMWNTYGPSLGIYDHAVPGEHTVRMFDPYIWTDDDGRKRMLSEDYAFCQRWRDIGGKVYMDASIPMAHIGTHAFQGCLGEWRGVDPTQTQEAAE